MKYICIFLTGSLSSLGIFKLIEIIFGELSSLSSAGLVISCLTAIYIPIILLIEREF